MSESAKYLHLTEPYLVGRGADIGCGALRVVPNAIGVDLPEPAFSTYNAGNTTCDASVRCDAAKLPFDDASLDFVYSSHLLEDFKNWQPLLKEWWRVLRQGGYLIVLVPDKKRFRSAVRNGQPDNPNHKRESRAGEITSELIKFAKFELISDKRTKLSSTDYTILFIGRKH